MRNHVSLGVAAFTMLALAGCRGGGALDPLGGSCGQTNERAAITVHQPSGDELSCATVGHDAGFSGTMHTWVGKVTASDAGSLTLETCEGDGGCSPGSLRVEAVAPGLDLSRFTHVWVRVRAQIGRFYACQQALEITTAVPADGSPPEGPAGKLLLAVVDGGTAFADSPYKEERVKLACPRAEGKGCGGPEPGVYAFDFSDAGGAGSPLRVSMGETKIWTLGGASYTVRNLRSFQSAGICDAYWDWAYTIYADPK